MWEYIGQVCAPAAQGLLPLARYAPLLPRGGVASPSFLQISTVGAVQGWGQVCQQALSLFHSHVRVQRQCSAFIRLVRDQAHLSQ